MNFAKQVYKVAKVSPSSAVIYYVAFKSAAASVLQAEIVVGDAQID